MVAQGKEALGGSVCGYVAFLVEAVGGEIIRVIRVRIILVALTITANACAACHAPGTILVRHIGTSNCTLKPLRRVATLLLRRGAWRPAW